MVRFIKIYRLRGHAPVSLIYQGLDFFLHLCPLLLQLALLMLHLRVSVLHRHLFRNRPACIHMSNYPFQLFTACLFRA
jgi:hypothetical protein